MAKRCCLQCGRDTNALYCSLCTPYSRFNPHHEQRGRESIETHDDDLIVDESLSQHGYSPPPKVDNYHGSTSRDDI